MTGSKFVISLDFELMWGVRDHRSIEDYGAAVLGGREAIPQILKLFERYRIRATWATVGLLFARTKTDMLDYLPRPRPTYSNVRLSPYDAIAKEIGKSERLDPLHFGRSLIERILQTEGQEISTHTFSHYYCLESGSSLESFSADIYAAKSIAKEANCAIESIVFPRNQMTDRHISICKDHGINIFRGNPGGFANRSRPQAQTTAWVRGARAIDSIAPIFGRPSIRQPMFQNGTINVAASRFLRPWSKSLPKISALQLRHVISEMRYAANKGELYHLWWHPHNMGLNTTQNMLQLEKVLQEYERLRDTLGMMSANMRDIAKAASR